MTKCVGSVIDSIVLSKKQKKLENKPSIFELTESEGIKKVRGIKR